MTFFYFLATQTTPRRLGGCPPSPSGGIASGRLEPVRHRAPPVSVPLSLGVCPSVGVLPLSEGKSKRQQHKEKPRRAFRGCLCGPHFDCFKISPNRTKGNNIKQIIKNIATPPNYAKVKRFASVVFVYFSAMSGALR